MKSVEEGGRREESKNMKDHKTEARPNNHTVCFEEPSSPQMPSTATGERSLHLDVMAARIVSTSMANASLLMKKQANKKCVRLEAKIIAWKSIANAALEIKLTGVFDYSGLKGKLKNSTKALWIRGIYGKTECD
eukprot:IDg13858t1